MKQTLLVFLLATLVFSCKKVDEPTSRQDTLRSGKWNLGSMKITTKKYGSTGDTTRNAIGNFLDSCEMDDYLEFGNNYTGDVNGASRKCSVNDQATLPYTWQITNGDNNLTISGAPSYFGTDEVKGTIVNFTDGSFSMRYDVYYQNPIGQLGDYDTAHIAATYNKF